MSKVNDVCVHLTFENVDETDIYVKLDLILQFLFKNKLNGKVVIDRHDVYFDDEN